MTVVRTHNEGETELVEKFDNAIDAVPFYHRILRPTSRKLPGRVIDISRDFS